MAVESQEPNKIAQRAKVMQVELIDGQPVGWIVGQGVVIQGKLSGNSQRRFELTLGEESVKAIMALCQRFLSGKESGGKMNLDYGVDTFEVRLLGV